MCQKTSNQTSSTTGAQDWTQVYQAVRWIQLIMALLSVLGSGSIIVRLTTQRLSRRPEMFPLLLLSVSDLLLASCWLLGAAMFSLEGGGGPGGGAATSSRPWSRGAPVLYLASFFCTLNYVWNLFTGIRDKFHSYMQVSNRVSTAARTTAVLSCLVPVLLTAPVFIQGNLSRCQANLSEPYRCLLVHTGPLFLGGQQSGSCRLLSSYSCWRVPAQLPAHAAQRVGPGGEGRRLYRRLVASHGYLGNQQRARLRVLDRRVLLFPLMFCLSWGPETEGVPPPPPHRGIQTYLDKGHPSPHDEMMA
ncbi:LOW QUALITY PROTEIN: transmembrane protein 116 [Menidia menidia]